MPREWDLIVFEVRTAAWDLYSPMGTGSCFPVFSTGYSLGIALEYTLLLRWSFIANVRLDSHKLPRAIPSTDLATKFPREGGRGKR